VHKQNKKDKKLEYISPGTGEEEAGSSLNSQQEKFGEDVLQYSTRKICSDIVLTCCQLKRDVSALWQT
jgi:hypothetical protein